MTLECIYSTVPTLLRLARLLVPVVVDVLQWRILLVRASGRAGPKRIQVIFSKYGVGSAGFLTHIKSRRELIARDNYALPLLVALPPS